MIMPVCYQMVGVPGSGKTTWIGDQHWEGVVVSTDQHVEEYARSVGKTYNEVFEDYMPTAVELMARDVINARDRGADIIWDQTSTTIKSRKKKFNMLPDYQHVAVWVQTPELAELSKRLRSRKGKLIPWDVVRGMIELFEPPTEEEGFASIIRV
jgi:predicted kinase